MTNSDNSFGGEVVTPETLDSPEKQAAFDFGAFVGRHGKDTRGPEIFAAAKALKQEIGYKKLGVIGFCYGGWGTLQLAGKGQFHTRSRISRHLREQHKLRHEINILRQTT